VRLRPPSAREVKTTSSSRRTDALAWTASSMSVSASRAAAHNAAAVFTGSPTAV
jgi:hypothetical protein